MTWQLQREAAHDAVCHLAGVRWVDDFTRNAPLDAAGIAVDIKGDGVTLQGDGPVLGRTRGAVRRGRSVRDARHRPSAQLPN